MIVTKIATRAVADHVDKLKPLTGESSHVCREPVVMDDRSAGNPLLAPVNQWGHPLFPLLPMSPHVVSRQARDLLDGIITVHRELPVHLMADERAPLATHREVVATGYTKQQVRAAWDLRRSALVDLSGVADELAGVDRRAAEINERISQLLTMATAP